MKSIAIPPTETTFHSLNSPKVTTSSDSDNEPVEIPTNSNPTRPNGCFPFDVKRLFGFRISKQANSELIVEVTKQYMYISFTILFKPSSFSILYSLQVQLNLVVHL
jgi:hypothetical protein